MKEDVLVVSTNNPYARVKVEQKEVCETCSARSLCIGQKQKDGTIIVLNPLFAKEGDLVTIDIPEALYTKTLIIIFSVLLGAAFFGLILGYLVSFLLPSSSTYLSLFGFFLGLVSGGLFLFFFFRQKKESQQYPKIIELLKKRDSHE